MAIAARDQRGWPGARVFLLILAASRLAWEAESDLRSGPPGQEGLDGVRVLGTGEDEPLPEAAVLGSQSVELGAGLDALGDDRESEVLAQLDQGVQEGYRLT